MLSYFLYFSVQQNGIVVERSHFQMQTQIRKNKPEVEQSYKPPKAHPQGHTASIKATPLKGSQE